MAFNGYVPTGLQTACHICVGVISDWRQGQVCAEGPCGQSAVSSQESVVTRGGGQNTASGKIM
jgi:hypothetical protein